MTNEQAIKYLQQLYPNGGHCWLDEQRIEAIGMAVKALQEEPVASKVLEDMLNAKTAAESLGISQEEHDRIVDELIYGKEPELVDVDDLPNKKEEPVSEKKCIYNRTLEERQKSCKFCSAACQVRIKEEPVSEVLEEEAAIYIERFLDGDLGFNPRLLHSNAKLSDVYDELNMIFKAGAKWKEKQMMAKAVDGDITFDYYGDGDKTYGCIAHDSFCLEDFGLKDRDKVKVIVIKGD